MAPKSPLVWVGLGYTTLSWAAPVVGLGVLLTLLLTYEDQGPQSQGLGALVVFGGAALVALLLNAAVAGVLAWRVPALRAGPRGVALCAGAGLGLLGLLAAAVAMSGGR